MAIFILSDGTFGKPSYHPRSSISIMHEYLIKNPDQKVFYDPGVATHGKGPYESFLSLTKYINLWQAATGSGINENIMDLYRYLILNYKPGEEVFLTGFSRGGYTARSFAGMVRKAGILDPMKILQSEMFLEQLNEKEKKEFDNLSEQNITNIFNKISEHAKDYKDHETKAHEKACKAADDFVYKLQATSNAQITAENAQKILKKQIDKNLNKVDEQFHCEQVYKKFTSLEKKIAAAIEQKIRHAFSVYKRHHLHPDHESIRAFRKDWTHFEDMKDTKIFKAMGIFDTVKSLGKPIPGWGYIDVPPFHDHKLSRNIENALHLVSIDEYRPAFKHTPMQASSGTNLTEIYCAGDHCDIGGGHGDTDKFRDDGNPRLCNLYLQKMVEFFKEHGAIFDDQIKLIQHQDDHMGIVHDSKTHPLYPLSKTHYRRPIDKDANVLQETVDRFQNDPRYNPIKLKQWAAENEILKQVEPIIDKANQGSGICSLPCTIL